MMEWENETLMSNLKSKMRVQISKVEPLDLGPSTLGDPYSL